MKSLFIVLVIMLNILNADNLIKIPEASGIDYSSSSNSFFVANDEGWIYEIDKKGNLLNKNFLGNYDLEGISEFNKETFLTVEENLYQVFIIDKKTLKIRKKLKLPKKGIFLFKKKRKEGLEGISYSNNKLYVSIQSKKKPSYILEYDFKTLTLINYFKIDIEDISGLKVIKDKLYAISDKKNKLLIILLKNKKIIKKVNLPGKNQEGITILKNKLYIADDSGNVFALKLKK